jgi:hypothetical protein
MLMNPILFQDRDDAVFLEALAVQRGEVDQADIEADRIVVDVAFDGGLIIEGRRERDGRAHAEVIREAAAGDGQRLIFQSIIDCLEDVACRDEEPHSLERHDEPRKCPELLLVLGLTILDRNDLHRKANKVSADVIEEVLRDFVANLFFAFRGNVGHDAGPQTGLQKSYASIVAERRRGRGRARGVNSRRGILTLTG